MEHLSTVHKWFIQHPIWLNVILGVAFFALSMYSKEIRLFLHFWPRKKLHSNDRILTGQRLQTLERLHNDTYALVLYLAVAITNTFVSAVVWNAIALGLWVLFIHTKPSFSLWTIVLAAFIGRIMQVNMILKELCTYEKSIADIKRSMAYHAEAEKRLAASGNQ